MASVARALSLLWLAGASIALSVIDLQTHRLPNAIVYPTIVVAAVAAALGIYLGTIGLLRTTADAESRSRTASAIVTVTQLLDRQARYADSINFPGTGASGARYIESRSWLDSGSPTLPAFATRMTEVVDQGGVTYSFCMIPADPTDVRAQRVQFTVEAGSTRTGSETQLAFVARNSGVLSPGNFDADNDGQSDPPFVCRPTGARP